MKSIVVVGAGLAGLSAAWNLSKDYKVKVIESNSSVQKNHSALLRFNEDITSFLPTKLSEVKVDKSIFYKGKHHRHSNPLFNNLYSQKVTHALRRRSIANLETVKRYIPPKNLVDCLFKGCIDRGVEFKFGQTFDIGTYKLLKSTPIIFTIPLPLVLKIFKIPSEVNFKTSPILTLEMNLAESLSASVHQTIYFPDLNNSPAYRISIIGDRIVAELPYCHSKNLANVDSCTLKEGVLKQVKEALGVDKFHTNWKDANLNIQHLGKLVNIEEELRKEYIYNLTSKYGVYLLGRFATWREKIMMPDVMKDIIKIEKWIDWSNNSNYDQLKKIF